MNFKTSRDIVPTSFLESFIIAWYHPSSIGWVKRAPFPVSVVKEEVVDASQIKTAADLALYGVP